MIRAFQDIASGGFALSIVKPVRRGLSANSTQSSLSSHHKYSGASHRLSAAANVGFVSDGGFPCRLSGLTFGRNDTAVAASEVGALRVLGSCHSGRRYTQRHSRLHPHLDSPCPDLGRRTAELVAATNAERQPGSPTEAAGLAPFSAISSLCLELFGE